MTPSLLAGLNIGRCRGGVKRGARDTHRSYLVSRASRRVAVSPDSRLYAFTHPRFYLLDCRLIGSDWGRGGRIWYLGARVRSLVARDP